jgi:hypothetical protein
MARGHLDPEGEMARGHLDPEGEMARGHRALADAADDAVRRVPEDGAEEAGRRAREDALRAASGEATATNRDHRPKAKAPTSPLWEQPQHLKSSPQQRILPTAGTGERPGLPRQ